MSETTIAAAPADRPATIRRYATLATITSIAIFFQALTAGQFVSQDGADSWITTHGVIADVSWVLGLITAAYAAWRLRDTHRDMVLWSAGLFVALLAQTGIGHLITDDGDDGWIAVHVPLAFAIFGVTIWTTARAWRLRDAPRSPRS
jgi:heme A synthase